MLYFWGRKEKPMPHNWLVELISFIGTLILAFGTADGVGRLWELIMEHVR